LADAHPLPFHRPAERLGERGGHLGDGPPLEGDGPGLFEGGGEVGAGASLDLLQALGELLDGGVVQGGQPGVEVGDLGRKDLDDLPEMAPVGFVSGFGDLAGELLYGLQELG
jgi:hypothetical protein